MSGLVDDLLRLYGPTMNAADVARVLQIGTRTLYNQRVADRCPVPMSRKSGRLVAQTRDVARVIAEEAR